jgi:two-component system LytT family sensor kinase
MIHFLFSKRAIPNYSVWLVTLLSTYIMKISDLGENKKLVYYFISECILWFFLGVFLTAAIQFGLEKLVGKKTILIKVLSLFLFMLIASLLFNFIFWKIIDIIHNYFLEKPSSYHGKIATRIFNCLNWIIWFVCFTALNLFREVKETKLKNVELAATLKESQLNTLKGQINPHFMFNSLNNIRGLILEDTNKARKMLTSLSETLRYALTQSSINAIALEKELEIVEKYIEISKIQFEERLQFKRSIDASSLHIKIPPMLIQMLVENGIKHGISNLKNGGEITLITKIKEGNLFIKVTNSGSLRNKSESTELGLQNIKKRLHLLYGKEAFFNLKEEHNNVVATIKIPLK